MFMKCQNNSDSAWRTITKLHLHGLEPLSSCLWVETHALKVVGSNPSTIQWMDIFHIEFVVKMH